MFPVKEAHGGIGVPSHVEAGLPTGQADPEPVLGASVPCWRRIQRELVFVFVFFNNSKYILFFTLTCRSSVLVRTGQPKCRWPCHALKSGHHVLRLTDPLLMGA